jgi:hypothetical protein
MERRQQIIDTESGEILSERVLKGNSNFVQLYRNEMTAVRELIKNNSKAGELFMFLLQHMDTSNALVVSRNTLAEVFETTDRSVSRWIKYLNDNNYVSITKSGNTNIYHVNSSIAWSSNAKSKEYATFTATVFVSRNEQESNLKYTKPKQLSLKFKNVDDEPVSSDVLPNH